MQNLRTADELSIEIKKREIQNAQELSVLKSLILKQVVSLEPLTMIKNKIRESVNNPDFLSNMLTTTMSLTTGFLVKKIVTGASHSPLFVKLLGFVAEMTTANAVNNNSPEVKSKIVQVFKSIWDSYRNSQKTEIKGF